MEREYITTTNQFITIDKLGLPRGDALGMWTARGAVVSELHSRKDAFTREINPSGEVPALVLGCGTVLVESEIVCEYVDAVSTRTSTARLIPTDPVAAARVRLAVKRFNAVPPAIVALLKNQDETRDEALTKALDAAIEKFVASLDEDEGAAAACSFGQHGCSLADVHAAPFVFRFDAVLFHYRGYRMIERHPRLGTLLRAVEALPEWRNVLEPTDGSYPAVTTDRLIALYATYASGGAGAPWSDGPDGPVLAGRGAVVMSVLESAQPMLESAQPK